MQIHAYGHFLRERKAITKTLRMMKLTVIILLIGCLQVSARGYGQRITLKETNAPLQKVFLEIEKQSGYQFFFADSDLKLAKKVSIDVKEAEVLEILPLCFKDQPLTFSISGKTVMVKLKEEPKKKEETTFPPPITVHGRVVNEKGDPLEGVTVTAKGTNKATSTNLNGEFQFAGIFDNTILVFTGTNVDTREVSLSLKSGAGDLLVTLKSKVSPLDEVQVIAYSTTSKRLNTGNVSTVKAEDIQKQPVSNPLAALEGRVPGMFITQQSGITGNAFDVQIRGQNSLRSSFIASLFGQVNGNSPLYILDGVPFTSTSLQLLTAANKTSDGNAANPLNAINPSDIESIEVLKDADATAIYGSRAANGVILITTKKGKVGQTKVDLNVYTGFGKVTRTQSFLNLRQYLDMRYEAFKKDGVVPNPSNAYDILNWDTTRYTDWQKLLIGGTAHYTDAQASISGGTERTQFIFGGGYHKETTVLPGNFNDQKGSAHFSLTHESKNQRFKAFISSNYVVETNKILRFDIVGAYLSTPPNAPLIYDSSGKLNWAGGNFDNPFAQFIQTYQASTNNLISSALLSYQILPGLKLKTNFGYTKIQMDETLLQPISSNNPTYGIATGSSFFNTNSINTWIIEPQADYEKHIGLGNINVLIGCTFQETSQKYLSQNATGYNSDNLLTNLAAAPNIAVVNTNNSQYRYNAFFGRLNYNIKDKYIVNITGRRDGSSRFGSGKQFGNFGAVGIGWLFSREKFIQNNLSFISFGKLRTSYGTTGSDLINDYQYLSTYSSTGYAYQNSIGLIPNRLSNSDFAWELNKKFEIGLEIGFLKDKILLSASWYRNRSSNQLVGYPLSLVTGFSSIQSNYPAVIQNTGLEFTMTASIIKSRYFSWNTSANISFPRNQLISFPGIEKTIFSSYLTVGQPLQIFKGSRFYGVDPQTGIYQFYNSKGNAVSTPSYPDDYQFIKKIGLKYYGGIQNNFQYKNFQLDFLFQFVNQIGKTNLYNFYPGAISNAPSDVLIRWQNPNDITSIQRFNENYSIYSAWRNIRSSDQVYSDASFIRLKNVSISYRLTEKWMEKAHFQNCRIYIQGQNLLTITKYKGLDPETQVAMPPLKVITAGFQLGF